MLSGARLLVTGVVTPDSLAFGCARRAQALGAEVVLTALPRVRDLAVKTAAILPTPVEVLDADLTAPDDVAAPVADGHAAMAAPLRHDPVQP